MKSTIFNQWNTEQFGKIIEYYQELDSTNLEAKRLARQGVAHGTLILAKSQTGGRGRSGRSWASKPGEGLYMSLVLRPGIAAGNASMLTLVAAMAVSDALVKVGVHALIKWPNDIVIFGRKVCGILTEMSADMTAIQYVVVGIGINVGQQVFEPELVAKAVSLAQAGIRVSCEELAGLVLESFEHYYQMFLRTEDLSEIRECYLERMVSLNQPVVLMDKSSDGVDQVTGICRGIDNRGGLMVEIDGKERIIYSGEVSVRGLLGYV